MTIDQDQLAAIQHAHRAGWAPRADHRKFLLDAVETLQAENERLRGDAEHWQQKWKRRGSALGARVETAEGMTEWLWDRSVSLVEKVTSGLARAEAAEAEAADLRTRLANVRALAEEWRAEADRYEQYAAGSSNPHELRSLAKTLRQNADALDGPQDGGDGR